ncbi:MAG: deoxyribonuclease IV [Endomicrobia bacterium]|nr:deoxyribonuclease IV [Endomicrobiia bacterium]
MGVRKRLKIGVHCSIRKGHKNALYEAYELGCSCLQMFTHSPRIWKFILPSEKEIEEFKLLRKQLGLSPLAIHTAYLPNPASSIQEIYKKTRDLLLLEFELAEMFSADYLVMHPGSYSEGKKIQDGLRQVVSCIDYCFEKTIAKFGNIHFKLLLENVCGNGRKIGRTFSEIAEIIFRSKFPKKIGICIDTAHAFAFGYNITTEEGISESLYEIKTNIGHKKIMLIHLNDTTSPLGSRIDRHYHIGKGCIGIEGFKTILRYFAEYPLLLETPKETSFDRVSPYDKKNLDMVRNLITHSQ